MTRFLWVNNVTSLTGGTAQATLCMLRSFPECQHTVLVRSGEWSSEASKVFGSNAKLESGKTINDILSTEQHDIVVYQNSPADVIPMNHVGNPLTVYYVHSARGDTKAAIKKCHKSLVVSKFLKNKLTLDTQVLHQPVMKVEGRRSSQFTVLRICTPNPAKWKLESFQDSLQAVGRSLVDVRFWFVGCPQSLQVTLCDLIGDKNNCEFMPAGYSARNFFANAHALLYDTDIKETFGRTVREAQRAGCVPVVRRIGGFSEQITDGVDGFLCDYPTDFASACRTLFESHQTWSAVSAAAMKTGNREGSLLTFRQRFAEFLTT